MNWSKKRFKEGKIKIDDMINKLGCMEENWEENHEHISALTGLIDSLEKRDEQYLQHKARLKWLQNGDSNTKFFYRMIIQHRRFNQIGKPRDSQGEWTESPDSIRYVVHDHFSSFFTSCGHRDWGSLLDCLIPIILNDMNSHLSKPIELEEIREVLFQMGGSKAPGPNDFHGVFFHSTKRSLQRISRVLSRNL